MIAKYHNSYFKFEIKNNQVRIWCFQPFEDFSMRITRRGAHLYEKQVALSEIEEIFDVGYRVKWHNEWFWCDPSDNHETVILRTTNLEEAKTHSFAEADYDRGQPIIWCRIVSVDECSEFEFYKCVFELPYFTQGKNDAKSDSFTMLSKNDWLEMHTKTKVELSPWNYADKN